jgi:hypothetical protein
MAITLPQLYISDETNVQDDGILWTEYLKVASEADERLVKDWTKTIDDLLVFVRFNCYYITIS